MKNPFCELIGEVVESNPRTHMGVDLHIVVQSLDGKFVLMIVGPDGGIYSENINNPTGYRLIGLHKYREPIVKTCDITPEFVNTMDDEWLILSTESFDTRRDLHVVQITFHKKEDVLEAKATQRFRPVSDNTCRTCRYLVDSRCTVGNFIIDDPDKYVCDWKVD